MDRSVRIAGVVLAGGRSSRMGVTKATIDIDGRVMGARVIDALRRGGCEPVVVFGGDAAELAVLDVPVWPDLYPGEGPVGAVIGVLTEFESESLRDAGIDAVLVAACDLPDLDETVTAPLIDVLADVLADRTAAEESGSADPIDVVVARTDRVEPMCALWRPSALPRLRVEYDRGVRAMHRVLDSLSVVEVDVPAAGLRNVNTVADLDRTDSPRSGQSH